MVSLEIHVWGYVKKATQKQRFAQCVDIDFSMVFLQLWTVAFFPNSLLFSNLSSQIDGFSRNLVKKATQKQRFATCVDIDFVPVFLNFGQLLFSIK